MIIDGIDLTTDVLVIAEIGNNHEGDFGLAGEMVHAAAAAGAQAVKFQTILPEKLVSALQPARLEQLARFALSREQFAELAGIARRNGIMFLSTPFSPDAVPWLDELVPAFKIASGDNNYDPLLKAVGATGKPVILSTGMAGMPEIEHACRIVESAAADCGKRADIALLHCVSAYPTPPEQANLRAIQTLAGAIAGCTALDNATLDNAYAEPSALAARMSLNTQHIVAYETGAAEVVDPLAGSYFVECLTNKVEEAAYRILEEIDSLGGMIAAIEKGYIQNMLREEANKKFRELDSNERLVVGVNHLPLPEGEEEFPIPIQEVHASDSEEIAARMQQWKQTRDVELVNRTLMRLHEDAQRGERFNLMPSIIEAVKVYATAGEGVGGIRMARGLDYDPFKTIDCPFPLREAASEPIA